MTLFADFNPAVSVPFSRVRQLFEDSGLQAGVVGATDFKVAQRGAGANMSVDVPAGQAWVEVTTGTRNGLAHIVNDATANVVVSASNGTNPRIDQIILRYNDSSIPTGSGDVPTLAVLTGTATSGATLDNRTGAAALSADSLRLADILVPATSTSVTTANIRDRRPWARGAFWRQSRIAGDYTVTATSYTALDSTNLSPRIECVGNFFVLTLAGSAYHSTTANTNIDLRFAVDGVTTDNPYTLRPSVTGNRYGFTYVSTWTPSVGSHALALYVQTGTGTAVVEANAGQPLLMTIQEIVRPNASNL